MNKGLYEKFLQCPSCRSSLSYQNNNLVCSECRSIYEIRNGIPIMLVDIPEDLALTIKKWDEIYAKDWEKGNVRTSLEAYENTYFHDIYSQLKETKNLSDVTYLEIGCGTFFLGQKIANECGLVIGIDVCYSALEIAKRMLDEAGIKNYLLINGDILNMPIKNGVIDLIYGGGVIEHFKDTQASVSELHRVLKRGGISFNSVPWLNFGSLTYRQVWGNIPNVPILKQLAELIHVRLLGSRHMIYGYEMSFTKGKMRKIHELAGFKKIKIDNFKVKLTFDFVPKSLRPILIKFTKVVPGFWPMMKVVAQK